MKKNFGLLWTIIQLVITAFVFSAALSFAWFSIERNNTATGVEIRAQETELFVSYTLYKYDSNHNLIIQSDITGTELPDLELTYYDVFIPDKNIDTAVIVVFTITGNKISYGTDSINVVLNRNSANIDTPAISDITEYSCYLAGQDLIDYTDFCELKDTPVTFFVNDLKKEQIIFNFSYELYTQYILNDTLNIVLYIDYNSQLIADNWSDMAITTEQLGGYTEFINDLTEIVIY